MTASHLFGVVFVIAGVLALALRRQDLIGERVAGDATILVAGAACLLAGAVFVLLDYLKKSVHL